ncbi:MAG: hypothetical protein KDA58_08760 [Planctomycetaceae bacterium]|nr:hypothetical protein [Planctomycetaceae bacterium]
MTCRAKASLSSTLSESKGQGVHQFPWWGKSNSLLNPSFRIDCCQVAADCADGEVPLAFVPDAASIEAFNASTIAQRLSTLNDTGN